MFAYILPLFLFHNSYGDEEEFLMCINLYFWWGISDVHGSVDISQAAIT